MKTRLLLLLWLLLAAMLPAAVQAQFTNIKNSDGTYSITGYNGPGGVVVIPNPGNGGTFTGITDGAFENYSNITSIVIDAGLTNIGNFAFADCTNITTVYFGGDAPADNGNAFDGDPAAVVHYEPGTTGWGPTFGGAPTVEDQASTPSAAFIYYRYNGFVTITGYSGPNAVAVIIPPFIYGWAVTAISFDAFSFCNITSVTIPNTVTNITSAFENCLKLTNAIVPPSVTTIGPDAFAFCSSLTSVTIPNDVTTIGDGAFFNCKNLPNIVIPPSANTIGPWAFGGCTALTNIVIPDSITNIGFAALAHCGSLTNISIGVANPAYSSTSGILFDKAYDTLVQYPAGRTCSSYTIPNSVTDIGSYAFDGCTNLTSVTIPDSATNIGSVAFEFCSNLKSACFEGNAPPDDGTAFSDDNNATTVYDLPGTTGWGATFGSVPTALWNPQATALSTEGNQFGFSISGPANTTIIVVACTDLCNPLWIPVSTNTLSNSGTSSYTDPNWASYPGRFYRFRQP